MGIASIILLSVIILANAAFFLYMKKSFTAITETMEQKHTNLTQDLETKVNRLSSEQAEYIEETKDHHTRTYDALLKNITEFQEEKLNQLHNDVKVLTEELLEKTEKQQQELLNSTKEIHMSTYQELFQSFQQKMSDYQADVFERVEQEVKKRGEETIEKLNVYLLQDEQEVQHWEKRIAANKGKPKEQLEMIESALNKFPSHKSFAESFTSILPHFLKSDEPAVRKSAIERYNRVARVFLDNCLAEDYEFAKGMYHDALRKGNEYVNEVQQQFRRSMEHTLMEMKLTIQWAKSRGHLTDQEVEDLEKLDQQVDQKQLRFHPDLEQQYHTLSKEMMPFFTPSQPNEEELKSYNQEAIEEIERAHDQFAANEYMLKKGVGLNSIAAMLGGWKSQYLFTATDTYYKAVYTEIFGKLNPSVKPKFTSMVVNYEEKEIS